MFHVGQKVVCVDAKPRWTGGDTPLHEGAIYTITKTYYHKTGPGVHLAEINHVHITSKYIIVGFYADRFRPVTERKTDISVFTEILNEQKRTLEHT